VKFVEILQGKWLGHPLHPAIVHVPIGAWFLACAMDLAGTAGWQTELAARIATFGAGAGLAFVLIAVPTGIAEWSAIKRDKPAWRIALWHMLLNVLATAIWATNFGLRLHATHISRAVLITSVAGTLVVLVSGWLGSLMVFDQGIGVARLSKKKWRAIAAAGGARLPEEKR
jgi:uncharacterized membrane protein